MSIAPENPYDPNPFGDSQASAAMGLAPRRPGGLTAICVVAIVLGVMGLISSSWKGVNLVAGRAIQAAITSMAPQPDPKMAKAQQEMNDAIWEETEKFIIPSIVLTTAQFGICFALVFGGIKSLGLTGLGRQVLVWACCLIVLFEIGQFVTFVFMQIRMVPVMEVHMSKIFEGTPNAPPGGDELFGTMMKFGVIVGLIFQGGWALIKVVFFGVAVWYLRSHRIVGLFKSTVKTSPETQAT